MLQTKDLLLTVEQNISLVDVDLQWMIVYMVAVITTSVSVSNLIPNTSRSPGDPSLYHRETKRAALHYVICLNLELLSTSITVRFVEREKMTHKMCSAHP